MPMLIVEALLRLGIPERLHKLLGILLLVLMLVGIWLYFGSQEAKDDKANQDLGAAVQRETDLRTSLERREQANEIRTEIRNPGSRARYDDCMRSARNSQNCKRFLPE